MKSGITVVSSKKTVGLIHSKSAFDSMKPVCHGDGYCCAKERKESKCLCGKRVAGKSVDKQSGKEEINVF